MPYGVYLLFLFSSFNYLVYIYSTISNHNKTGTMSNLFRKWIKFEILSSLFGSFFAFLWMFRNDDDNDD